MAEIATEATVEAMAGEVAMQVDEEVNNKIYFEINNVNKKL